MEIVQEFRDTTDFSAERLLQVNSCGSEHVTKYDYTILRSKGRSDYHFLYIQSGWLDAEIGFSKVHVDAGKCIVYLPDTRQMYTLTSEGAPVTCYIHFTGEAAAEAMGFIPLTNSMVYDIADRTEFEDLFRQIIRVHNMKNYMYIPKENGLLLQMIAMLASSGLPADKPYRSDILSASAYIREHFFEEINLTQYAASMYLSLSRFAHLFTETVGYPPHKYIIMTRIDKAKGLLRDSLMSVREIAESVGYSDPLYFSRLFRRYTGATPSAYRQQHFNAAE